jgi:hypothetical protein
MSRHAWTKPVPGGAACGHVGCTLLRLGGFGRDNRINELELRAWPRRLAAGGTP